MNSLNLDNVISMMVLVFPTKKIYSMLGKKTKKLYILNKFNIKIIKNRKEYKFID